MADDNNIAATPADGDNNPFVISQQWASSSSGLNDDSNSPKQVSINNSMNNSDSIKSYGGQSSSELLSKQSLSSNSAAIQSFGKGDILMYIDGSICEVLQVHYDDSPPYYSVRFCTSKRERQTTAEKLRYALPQEREAVGIETVGISSSNRGMRGIEGMGGRGGEGMVTSPRNQLHLPPRTKPSPLPASEPNPPESRLFPDILTF